MDRPPADVSKNADEMSPSSPNASIWPLSLDPRHLERASSSSPSYPLGARQYVRDGPFYRPTTILPIPVNFRDHTGSRNVRKTEQNKDERALGIRNLWRKELGKNLNFRNGKPLSFLSKKLAQMTGKIASNAVINESSLKEVRPNRGLVTGPRISPFEHIPPSARIHYLEPQKNKIFTTEDKIIYLNDHPARKLSVHATEQKTTTSTVTKSLESCNISHSTRTPKERTTPSAILEDYTTDNEEENESSEHRSASSSTASSTSLWPSSLDTVARENIIPQILDESRRLIVDQLMLEIHVLLNRQLCIRRRTNARSPSYSSQQDSAGGSSEEFVEVSPNNSKRYQDENSASKMPGDGQDDGDFSKQQQKSKLSKMDGQPHKLACPYYKRNPRLHQGCRSCAGPGWSSCHRVKEHLYRRHKLPISCPRCRTPFPDDRELSDHLMQLERCAIQIAGPVQGINRFQEAQLRTRRRTTETEAQRWREIFLILFPHDDQSSIPSPYYEPKVEISRKSDQLADYDRYMARELPHRIRARLEATVRGASASLLSELQPHLIDTIRDCQRDLYRAYAVEQDPQIFTTEASPGPSSNEPASLIAPPEDALADLNAYFPPPTFQDEDHLFTYDDWHQSSSELCHPMNYSDSGYVSQSVNTYNVMDGEGQNEYTITNPIDEYPDIQLQGSGFEGSMNTSQINHADWTSMESWHDQSEDDRADEQC